MPLLRVSRVVHASLSSQENILTTTSSFGAVIEEFEVRDTLLALFAQKDGTPVKGQFFAPHEVPVYS